MGSDYDYRYISRGGPHDLDYSVYLLKELLGWTADNSGGNPNVGYIDIRDGRDDGLMERIKAFVRWHDRA